MMERPPLHTNDGGSGGGDSSASDVAKAVERMMEQGKKNT